jgi:uroporphyrinogen-III synthase
MAKHHRILVTRPKEDAKALVEALEARGAEVYPEPLISIEPCAGAKPKLLAEISRKPQAVLITSANGVRALAKYSDERAMLLLTVGDASAEAARAAGFSNVHSAGGDANDLISLVEEKCSPDKGTLLHIAGTVVAGNLAKALNRSGFKVERITAYKAEAATRLSEGARRGIISCEFDLVLFYSPRTARVFDKVLRAEKLDYLTPHMEMVGLSRMVVSELAWRKVHICKNPTTAAMLELIDTL